MEDAYSPCGRTPKNIALEWEKKADRAYEELCAEFDALPEAMKKDMRDFLFEYTESIMKSIEDSLKYTEPLRVIGLGDYKI